MISGRSLTEDTTFSRPRPARAARRSAPVRGTSGETSPPPPPYDSSSPVHEEACNSDASTQSQSKHTEPRPRPFGPTFLGEHQKSPFSLIFIPHSYRVHCSRLE